MGIKKGWVVFAIILSLGALIIIFNAEEWKINKWLVSLAYIVNIASVVWITITKSSK